MDQFAIMLTHVQLSYWLTEMSVSCWFVLESNIETGSLRLHKDNKLRKTEKNRMYSFNSPQYQTHSEASSLVIDKPYLFEMLKFSAKYFVIFN